MKIRHLKEMTASALITSYLALTNSSVIFTASGGQIQNRLTQAANTVQSILTGLVILVGICVALLITVKRMPGTGGPQEKSGVCHATGRVARLVILAAAATWLLPRIYGLFT